MSDNMRGSVLMVVAMALFALEDMFIKLLSAALPVGQILMVLGTAGALVFGALVRLRREPLFPRAMWSAPVVIRNLGEAIGGVCFVLAISLTPLSSASAILQAAPLAVTLGAALFLGEPVGWRRWSAILVGFFGVMLIVRPGLDGFEPASLLAVVAVLALAARDLATRRVPARLSGYQLSAWAFAAIVPAGAVMLAIGGAAPVMPGAVSLAQLAGALVVGLFAYYALVGAVRTGEVAVVTPFRYTRMLFALGVGITVFGERPDALMLTGAAIIVAAGLFTIWRETQARASKRATGGV